MSSNINPYTVDGTFPIANQDNSSQGFRDNFTNIKNNFIFAENEISDLQSKAIVASALNGQTLNNDMAGTQIRRPQLAAWTQTLLDNGAASGALVLDFDQANFQKITTSASISLNFINWPTSTGAGALGYGVMRVWIVVSDTAHTLTLPASVSIGVNDIAWSEPNVDGTNTITFDAPGNYIFDFSSIDGGNNYQIFDLSRNRATFRDPALYFNAEVNSTFLIGYGADALPIALTLEQGADKISVAGSYNSVAAGLNYTGNIAYTQNDNGPGAGYSATGFRGNLATGTINSSQDGDLTGYFNSLTFTSNGAGGLTPQTVGSIGFYARGANVAAGLGGNVTIWTTPDGSGTTPFVAQRQAIGIENDQSVQFFGNVTIAGKLSVPSINDLVANLTSLSATVSNIIAGAPGALDTLVEIDQSLANNTSLSSTLTNLISNVQANVTATNTAIANIVNGTTTLTKVTTSGNVAIFGNLFVSNTYVPTSSTSAGTVGQISYDSGNVYICLGPNNWKKAPLSTF